MSANKLRSTASLMMVCIVGGRVVIMPRMQADSLLLQERIHGIG